MFLDKFGFPILYYRANPHATSDTRILQLDSERDPEKSGSGVYDGRDNAVFTGHASGDRTHALADAGFGVPATEQPGGYRGAFVNCIRSPRLSERAKDGRITFSRPVDPDSFILLSPGKDGMWGSTDDIANFDRFDR